jgi:hypothetical protein
MNQLPTNIEQGNTAVDIPGENNIQTSIMVFIKLLLKNWYYFLIVGLLAGIAGIVHAYKQPILYESRLSFALDEGGSSGGGGGLMGLASQFGLNIGGSNDVFGGDNIMMIIKSRRMIEQSLLSADSFNGKPQTLINYYLNNFDKQQNNDEVVKKPIIRFPLGQTKASLSYQQDSVLYRLYLEFESDYITTWKPDKYLNIIEVKVVSRDEKFTKIFTNHLISETNSFYTEMRSKKARETLDILEQRVAEMKGRMNTSISEKATIQDANLNPVLSAAQAPAIKSQTNIQTYGAAYAEMFKNLELARYQYLKQIPLMQIIDNADYPMHKIKTGKIKTGFLFAIFAVAFSVLLFWLIRIVKEK